jgi:uncharacterized protein
MESKEIVLISGASGLIGKRLTSLLLTNGYQVRHLSRVKKNVPNVKCFIWNVEQKTMDIAALDGCNYIIHLAGEGIADERWTDDRKKKIIDSRVNSAQLLYDKAIEAKSPLKAFVSASGINYYGINTTDKIHIETDQPAADFIGNCCVLWEKQADLFGKICRVVKFRTAVVLAKEGGALKKIAAPVKLGLGSALGKGSQFVPWIHIDDIANLYFYAIKNQKLVGVFNATSSEHVTNNELTKAIAKALQKPFFMPNIPAFFIKLIFGEMGNLVLEGSRASNKKIIDEGFVFEYDKLEKAILREFAQ